MSVTAVDGFVAAGIHCGIKPVGVLDLAFVGTDDGRPVPAAAVFTANKAVAAPVQVSRAHLAATGGRAAAVVLNSGNANAATGAAGRDHAVRTCALVAEQMGCAADEILVCSTGLIGIPLPFDTTMARAVGPLVAARGATAGAGLLAARAIMTTDTRPRLATVAGDGFTVGGMAKGAAMLAPDMATMLAVLTTDAAVEPAALHDALAEAVDRSFNALTVDGCTSTNDTVIVLANGRAGRPLGGPASVAKALGAACASLAAQMAADAEGATKVATIRVRGAASPDDARRAARRVAESELVKCSLYGADPYWGRVVSELGSSGAAFDLDRVSVAYGGVTVCRDGVAVDHDRQAVAAHLAGTQVAVLADLGLGEGEAVILTTDLTHAYIDENMGTS